MDIQKEIDFFRKALDSIGGVIIVDKDNKIVFMNDKYTSQMNIKAEHFIGKNITELLPDSKLPFVTATGKEDIAKFYKSIKGQSLIVNRVPIIKDNEVIGAVGVTTFANIDEVEKLNEKISILNDQSKYYKSELETLRGAKYSLEQIVSKDTKILQLKEYIKKASQTKSTILISGESGTGKELFAHATHKLSQRNHFAFVRMNCAAIPENLLESELFGYVEGAFTGAKKGGSIGKFELANHGTLLLDEINALPLKMQAKLLRVIQEKEVQRIGDQKLIELDVRLIFSTNQDLLDLVNNDSFREDLYYRINVVEIKIPPLRERMDDIPLLVSYLIPKLNHELGLNITGIQPAVLELFSTYYWPGNVRELENCLERAFNSALSGELKLEHFSFFYNKIGMHPVTEKRNSFSLRKSKEATEKNAIIYALKLSKGNKKLAAEMLEIDRSVLYDKLKKYEISFDLKSE